MLGEAVFFDLEKRSAVLSKAGDPLERMNALRVLQPFRDLVRPRRPRADRGLQDADRADQHGRARCKQA